MTPPEAGSGDTIPPGRAALTGALALILISGLAALAFRWPAPADPILIESSAAPGRELRVQITGEVQRPGVHAFSPGDRVEDAVRAAGGPTESADLGRLNLAARLRDEGRVHVPARLSGATGAARPTARINVNAAPAAELETLPGIGPVRARRIVESRDRDGPFPSVDDLRGRRLLGPTTLDRIRDRIVAE